MRARLLISVDESTGPLAAVRALRRGGFVPFVATSQRGTYAARSRHAAGEGRVPGPHVGADAHAKGLADLAARLDVDAVLPGTEGSLVAVTGRERHFGGLPVATGPADALRRMTDKAGLGAVVEPHGLRTPPSVVVASGSADLPDVAFPAIVKPVRTVGETSEGGLETRRGLLVEDGVALRELLARPADGEWLLQEFKLGPVAAVSGVAWEGLVLSVLHQRAHLTWPQPIGTSALAVTEAPDRDVEERVASLLGDLKWSGIYNLQFLRADDGLWLIDVNPRVYGSIALAVAAGHDLPSLWARCVLGETPEVPPYRVGVGLRIEDRWLRARAAELTQRGAGRPASDRPHETHAAVFAHDDPRPGLTLLGRGARRALRGALG